MPRARARSFRTWPRFFDDISELVGRPLTFDALWGPAHDSTRDASYALVSEVLRPLDDRLRLVLVLESTSHIFFEHSARLTRALCQDTRLKYFSTHHEEAEAQHELFEKELEAWLCDMALPPSLCAAAFEAMFHGLRGYH